MAAFGAGIVALGLVMVPPPAGAVSYQRPLTPVSTPTHGRYRAHHVHVVHTGGNLNAGGTVAPRLKHLVAHVPITVPAPGSTTPAVNGSPPASVAAPQTSPQNDPTLLPALGKATAIGCAAALAYLETYAAPDFILQCPGNAQGHQATTMCISAAAPCDLGRFIVIADPCPAAYMNEASNSWVLLGLSKAVIDPYGRCW